MLVQSLVDSLSVHAPAKLNLFLNVLGRRPDGYHELETLMVSVGIYDTLRFRPAADGAVTLRCADIRHGTSHPAVPAGDLPVGPDNLICRAAELLRQSTGCTRGVCIDLFKRIPLAAGLAGGSSDAAAALVGLNRFWNLGLSHSELHDLAARLGSDIPFFLSPTPAAICRGRGERVEPLRLPLGLHFVIARPPTGLSTAQVFQNYRPSPAPHSVAAFADSLQTGHLARAATLFHNSLQEPAERLNPDVSRLKAAFARLPFLGHQMSGSGTSYFGLCSSQRQARQLSTRLRAARLGDVFAARSRP